MPQGPVARVGDNVTHPLPPVLGLGPGAPTVLIGFHARMAGHPSCRRSGIADREDDG